MGTGPSQPLSLADHPACARHGCILRRTRASAPRWARDPLRSSGTGSAGIRRIADPTARGFQRGLPLGLLASPLGLRSRFHIAPASRTHLTCLQVVSALFRFSFRESLVPFCGSTGTVSKRCAEDAATIARFCLHRCQLFHIQDGPCKPSPTARLQGTRGRSALRFSHPRSSCPPLRSYQKQQPPRPPPMLYPISAGAVFVAFQEPQQRRCMEPKRAAAAGGAVAF